MATQLLQVNAITKVVQYQGVEKTIPDTYWTSDIVPAIYPNWDSDKDKLVLFAWYNNCLLYTSPSPRDLSTSRMPSSA